MCSALMTAIDWNLMIFFFKIPVLVWSKQGVFLSSVILISVNGTPVAAGVVVHRAFHGKKVGEATRSNH